MIGGDACAIRRSRWTEAVRSPAAQKPLSMVVYTTKFGRHFELSIASKTRMPPARSPAKTCALSRDEPSARICSNAATALPSCLSLACSPIWAVSSRTRSSWSSRGSDDPTGSSRNDPSPMAMPTPPQGPLCAVGSARCGPGRVGPTAVDTPQVHLRPKTRQLQCAASGCWGGGGGGGIGMRGGGGGAAAGGALRGGGGGGPASVALPASASHVPTRTSWPLKSRSELYTTSPWRRYSSPSCTKPVSSGSAGGRGCASASATSRWRFRPIVASQIRSDHSKIAK
eukprot:scaffold22074_cov90-Isochrysis_galbana.AAC.3